MAQPFEDSPRARAYRGDQTGGRIRARYRLRVAAGVEGRLSPRQSGRSQAARNRSAAALLLSAAPAEVPHARHRRVPGSVP